MDAAKAAAAGIIALDQLYLMSIIGTCNALKLSAVLQDTGNDSGRLWLVPAESTVPLAQITFAFGTDDVKLGVITRDERELVRVVRYGEGLDGFLPDFMRFMQAGRLAAPKRAA